MMKRWLSRFLRRWVPAQFQLPLSFLRARLTGGVEAELWILKRWRNASGVAIDVGANQGFYSLKLAQWFGRVEAFEPNVRIGQRLRAYRSPRIRVHDVALSSQSTEAPLHIPISAGGTEYTGWGTLDAISLPPSDRIRVDVVPLRTLDSFGFEGVVVIKIDVEGHERDVLAGAVDTIRRCRPIILLEVKLAARECVGRLFGELRYILYQAQNNGDLHRLESFCSGPLDAENFFAFPDGADVRA